MELTVQLKKLVTKKKANRIEEKEKKQNSTIWAENAGEKLRI